MQQAWDQSSGMQTYTDSVKDAQERGKVPGNGRGGGRGEFMQSAADKQGLCPGGPLPGGGAVQAGQQQQQPLLTPASLQLAQLQAQLTLHRLRLASAGGASAGASAAAAAAASVLSQVLSNVAMSQPLFSQVRTSSPQGSFPTGVLGFPGAAGPGSGPAQATLGAGACFSQSSVAAAGEGNVRRSDYGGGGAVMGRHGGLGDYEHKPALAYPSDGRYGGFRAPIPAAAAATGDRRYTAGNAQANDSTNTAGFHGNFYGQDAQGQRVGFGATQQDMNAYAAADGHKGHWRGPANQGHPGKADVLSSVAWTATGQPLRTRAELYNPEEPTAEPKFNPTGGTPCFGPGGTQGFVGYQSVQGVSEPLPTGSMSLQPHQVNDYHAVTPTLLPHQCTICDKKVYNLKDWDHHVKGKLHLQNCSSYATIEGPGVVASGPVHYTISGSSEVAPSNSMVYSAPTQDASSAASVSYLQAAAMTTYPMSSTGFTSHQPVSKPFLPRNSTPGRVVHICNLPEGSCTENDVINLGLPFGKVTNYILMRSTHQAFLEMAYVEAAQAMVQYYQLTPATISDQKLLIRMSKRYKELQLKKPGKNVDSIIQDINSQRGRDDIQELDHYTAPERARSRSPISRSLSPRSHSPSFTSCSSAHSPQGAPCQGPERSSNGVGPRRSSWDRSSHLRRAEEDREREWDDLVRRNGGVVEDERPNGRPADRRKPHLKHADGGGGVRSSRDWFPRGSPQGSYRNVEEEFYMKEPAYKMEKPPRPPYPRHEVTRSKRREGEYHSRSRYPEADATDELSSRPSEDKRHVSPARGRSRRSSRQHVASQKLDSEKAAENNDRQIKDKSPERSIKQSEATECEEERDSVELGSGDDTEEECWYPRNMEELVTVDEVGEEDDAIIEPDLPELAEDLPSADRVVQLEVALPATSGTEVQQVPTEERTQENSEGVAESCVNEKAEDVLIEVPLEGQTLNPVAAELQSSQLSNFPGQEFKAALKETCSEDKVPSSSPPQGPMLNHVTVAVINEPREVEPVSEVNNREEQRNEEAHKRDAQNTIQHSHPNEAEIEMPAQFREQDKVISEHSIPLGVEFIVPRTGFYCKLCGLFYTSEETAKTAHCRSTVHYRNLQKYLSQLAEESLFGVLTEPSSLE